MRGMKWITREMVLMLGMMNMLRENLPLCQGGVGVDDGSNIFKVGGLRAA
jgi:hypothetical protein